MTKFLWKFPKLHRTTQQAFPNRQGNSKRFCNEEDIMIGRYGASVGKVFWGKKGAYNVALIKLDDFTGSYDKQFLFLMMQSEDIILI